MRPIIADVSGSAGDALPTVIRPCEPLFGWDSAAPDPDRPARDISGLLRLDVGVIDADAQFPGVAAAASRKGRYERLIEH